MTKMPDPIDAARQRRHVRFRLVLGLFYLGLGLVLFGVRFELEQYFGARPDILLILAGTSAIAGAAILLLSYLRGDVRIPFLETLEPDQSSSRQDLQRLERSLSSIHRQMADVVRRIEEVEELSVSGAASAPELDAEERERLLSSLADRLPEGLAEELRIGFEREIGESALRRSIREILDATVYRLRTETSALARRGNLNLVIGVLTTTIAVGLLAYMVMGVTRTLGTVAELVQYYVPRVSTAAFIEIFSFFFLRLYRSSLQEIRYYQDELTRLTESRIALLAVEASGNSELLGEVASCMTTDGKLPAQPAVASTNSEELKSLSGLLETIARAVRTGFVRD